MRRFLTTVLLLTLFCSPTWCQVVTRDSAGFRIIESRSPLWNTNTAWHLGRELVRLASAEATSPMHFNTAASALRLPDGTIVITDMGNSELRFFDAGGRHVRSVGRKGSGPGEFEQLMAIQLIGDSTLVVEAGRDRWSMFTLDGKHLRDVALRTVDPRGPAYGAIRPFRFLPDGRVIGGNWPQGVPNGRILPWVDSITWYVRAQPTAEWTRLMALPAITYYPQERYATRLEWGPQFSTALADDRIYHDYSSAFQVALYGLDGKPQQLWRRVSERRPVTQAMKDEYERDFVNAPDESGGTSERWRQFRAGRFREMVFAEEIPARQRMLLDRAGNIWMSHFDPFLDFVSPGMYGFLPVPAKPTTWTVFSSEGRWLGEVELPARFVPSEIGADYILGIQKDEGGPEAIVLYALVKPAGR